MLIKMFFIYLLLKHDIFELFISLEPSRNCKSIIYLPCYIPLMLNSFVDSLYSSLLDSNDFLPDLLF